MKAVSLITGTLLSFLLVSCSSTNQEQGTYRSVFSKALTGSPFATAKEPEQTPSKPEQEKPEIEEPSLPAPTPEQQPAAEILPSETGESILPAPVFPPMETSGDLPTLDTPSAPSIPEPAATPLPSRSLRLGLFAPPEEAASAKETPALPPNSVDLRGLRSPKLPGALPMDINGKITPNNER